MKRIEPLNWLFMLISLPLILLLTLPLIQMTFEPSVETLMKTIADKEVMAAIARSLSLSLCAGMLSFAMERPLPIFWPEIAFPEKESWKGSLIFPS